MGSVTLEVDMAACCGSGMCAELAPGLFEMDDRGNLVVLRSDVPAELVADAQEAEQCCPVAAITLATP
jgi:ferredoxin